MACADSLAAHPDKFDVTLIEAQDYCGGQMFSIPIDENKFGAPFLNQGVQGGSHIYHHTFRIFNQQGFSPEPVNLQVAFGKNENFWTNVFPTQLVERHSKEIARFRWVMRFIRWFELLFMLIPIKVTLRLFFFSKKFINYMIYPSLALFLGTGNATPDLPTIMMERLYTSPTYGMWYPVDKHSLSSNLPPMVVFPNATAFYSTWADSLRTYGVNIRLNTPLLTVKKRDAKGVTVVLGARTGHGPSLVPSKTNDPAQCMVRIDKGQEVLDVQTEEHYDEIVFCILADSAKKLLGKSASLSERFVLGNTRWSDDVTVTHNDVDYMRKWYEPHFRDDLAVRTLPGGRDQTARVEEGRAKYLPMYYIKQVPADSRKLEMCFDCTAFQAQLPKDAPFENHVFQTIFLNKKHNKTWQKHEIAPEKIIREDWWHQLMHSWTHYAFVVPLVWILNRFSKRTRFAGAWTLVNAHELAIISGMAAAYSLGAAYPKDLVEDQWARRCFRLYLLLTHGRWFDRKRVI